MWAVKSVTAPVAADVDKQVYFLDSDDMPIALTYEDLWRCVLPIVRNLISRRFNLLALFSHADFIQECALALLCAFRSGFFERKLWNVAWFKQVFSGFLSDFISKNTAPTVSLDESFDGDDDNYFGLLSLLGVSDTYSEVDYSVFTADEMAFVRSVVAGYDFDDLSDIAVAVRNKLALAVCRPDRVLSARQLSKARRNKAYSSVHSRKRFSAWEAAHPEIKNRDRRVYNQSRYNSHRASYVARSREYRLAHLDEIRAKDRERSRIKRAALASERGRPASQTPLFNAENATPAAE